MKNIAIDRAKRLKEEPHTGHNRWHPDIAPIVEIAPGEEIVLETRDASDGQIKPGMTVASTATQPRLNSPNPANEKGLGERSSQAQSAVFGRPKS